MAKIFVIVAHGTYSSSDGTISIPQNISLFFAVRDKDKFYVDKLDELLKGEDWHRWYPKSQNVENYTFNEFQDIVFNKIRGIHEVSSTTSGTIHWRRPDFNYAYPFNLNQVLSCLATKYPNDNIQLYIISCREHI